MIDGDACSHGTAGARDDMRACDDCRERAQWIVDESRARMALAADLVRIGRSRRFHTWRDRRLIVEVRADADGPQAVIVVLP